LIRHIETFLTAYPHVGAFDSNLRAYRSWVPKTPFFVFYRVDAASNTMALLALMHHARDRDTFEVDE
jgi:hypothetical protein